MHSTFKKMVLKANIFPFCKIESLFLQKFTQKWIFPDFKSGDGRTYKHIFYLLKTEFSTIALTSDEAS